MFKTVLFLAIFAAIYGTGLVLTKKIAWYASSLVSTPAAAIAVKFLIFGIVQILTLGLSFGWVNGWY